MSRYRWFSAKWPVSMRSLAKKLKSRPFGEERLEGFVLDRVRDDYLEARFVERLEYDDTVVDPFGKEFVFHRVEFRQCRFRASSIGPGLELLDAPRSVQTMISRLAEITEFEFSVAPLTVDVLAWAKALQKQLNVLGTVDSLQIGSIELEPGIVAKVVIKGSTDVLSAGSRLTAGKKHTVEKLQVRLDGDKRLTLLLTNSGVVKVDCEPAEGVLEALRNSLNTLL